MKIVFTGLPYFGKKLVAELQSFDPKNKYVFCNTYYSRVDRFRFIFHLLKADRVISFNGVTSRSKSLDWVLRFKKKLIIQWHGSDVLTAKSNKTSGTFTRRYVDYSANFTDAEWLQQELKELGIQASILHFKHVDASLKSGPFETADAITYIAEGNEEFYGIKQVRELASAFPGARFHVVGTTGKNYPSPANVIFYGWVNEGRMKQLLDQNAVFIRLTAHDGYSLSVMEAIANGNYVIWNNPHPQVNVVSSDARLLSVFAELQNRVAANNRSRDADNLQWAKQNLGREKVLGRFIQAITQ